jgi:hypothetical protein
MNYHKRACPKNAGQPKGSGRREDRTNATASRRNSCVYFDGRPHGDAPSFGLENQSQGVHIAGGSPVGVG